MTGHLVVGQPIASQIFTEEELVQLKAFEGSLYKVSASKSQRGPQLLKIASAQTKYGKKFLLEKVNFEALQSEVAKIDTSLYREFFEQATSTSSSEDTSWTTQTLRFDRRFGEFVKLMSEKNSVFEDYRKTYWLYGERGDGTFFSHLVEHQDSIDFKSSDLKLLMSIQLYYERMQLFEDKKIRSRK